MLERYDVVLAQGRRLAVGSQDALSPSGLDLVSAPPARRSGRALRPENNCQRWVAVLPSVADARPRAQDEDPLELVEERTAQDDTLDLRAG